MKLQLNNTTSWKILVYKYPKENTAYNEALLCKTLGALH